MKLIRILIILSLATYYLLPATPVHAAVNFCDYFPPCAYFKTPSDIMNAIVPVVMSLAGVLLFILLIVSGFQIIMHAGSGDAKELVKWRTTLAAAIIGFIIMISAFWIIKVIESVTEFQIPGF